MGRLGGRLECTEESLAPESVDMNPLGNQDAGVEATHGLDPEEPAIIDVTDQKTDLVHVRRDQHLGAAVALLVRDHIAHDIDSDRIDQRRDLVDHDLADTLFTAGDTRGFAETLQKGKVHADFPFYCCAGIGRIQMLRNLVGFPWSCRRIGPGPCFS